MKNAVLLSILSIVIFAMPLAAADTKPLHFSSTEADPCSITFNQDLTFIIPNAIYDAGPFIGKTALKLAFHFFGEQNGQLMWKLGDVGTPSSSLFCSVSIAPDLSFAVTDAVYGAGPMEGNIHFQADFEYYGEQAGSLLWRLGHFKIINDPPVIPSEDLQLDKTRVTLEAGESETVTISGGTGRYQPAVSSNAAVVGATMDSIDKITIFGVSSGTATITVEDSSGSTTGLTVIVTATGNCGAYVAPGIWKEFDCYNLAAIGKTTIDDPLMPSWRLIGGYWQWGRKGPYPSQWYDTNTANFAHGPVGPDVQYANDGDITGWDQANALDGSWSDASKTVNDPCPEGFRVPTASQWDGVRDNNTQSAVGTWSSKASNYSSARFFGSDLMLPAAGSRNYSGKGWLNDRGGSGSYWSSSESTAGTAWFLYYYSSDADANIGDRREGFSVRCIKDAASSQNDVLTLGKNVVSLVSGGKETVAVSGKYENFTVITSDSKIAMVTMTEKRIDIEGVSPGTATVTVKDNRGRTATVIVTVLVTKPSPIYCGANVAPGVWKKFECYNLAAIGKITRDDPFTPSWRLIGGYWQWGRKGPDPSDWYDMNMPNFAHGPTGPGRSEANAGEISGWDNSVASNAAWSDSSKTANDPCSAGYRVPTKIQWDGVRNNNTQSIVGTWNEDDTNYSSARFFGSDLMLPAAGNRFSLWVNSGINSGALLGRGGYGLYWSSSDYAGYHNALSLYFGSRTADTASNHRRMGLSVRCIAE